MIHDGKFCAAKDFNTSEIIVSKLDKDDCIEQNSTILIADVNREEALEIFNMGLDIGYIFPGYLKLSNNFKYKVTITDGNGKSATLNDLTIQNFKGIIGEETNFGKAIDFYHQFNKGEYFWDEIIDEGNTFIVELINHINNLVNQGINDGTITVGHPLYNLAISTVNTLNQIKTQYNNQEFWIFRVGETSETSHNGLNKVKISI